MVVVKKLGDTVKLYFIINPKSGKEKPDIIIKRLKALLKNDAFSYEFHLTTKPNHAIALAEAAASSNAFDRIVAVGGDGTLNEVINGMLRIYLQNGDKIGGCPPLGIIPAGLGNDTARGLKIPRRLKDAYIILSRGLPTYIDVGEVNGRFFINGIGVGYDGAVISQMYEIRKRGKVLSGWIYFRVLIHQILRFKSPTLHVEIDETSLTPRKYLLVLTANGTSFGGIFNLTPKARVNDGLLDVLLVEDIPKSTFLLNIPKAITGRHLGLKQVHYYTSRKVTIKSPTQVPCHIDGECYYNSQFSIKLLPKVLQVVLPGPLP